MIPYDKENQKFPEIKSVFVGQVIKENESENFTIAFQRFRKDQYISTESINLFHTDNTFFREKRFGISLTNIVDCLFVSSELQFTSFYFARQVFDLSKYYRTAEDAEVNSFLTNSKLQFEDSKRFTDEADSWIRRKIAVIRDSGVLERTSAEKIQKLAKKIGIEVAVIDSKLVIPIDKEKKKIVLGFLDEEAYKGPFSKALLLANSKRVIK